MKKPFLIIALIVSALALGACATNPGNIVIAQQNEVVMPPAQWFDDCLKLARPEDHLPDTTNLKNSQVLLLIEDLAKHDTACTLAVQAVHDYLLSAQQTVNPAQVKSKAPSIFAKAKAKFTKKRVNSATPQK